MKITEIKIKDQERYIDATIEVVDGVMVVSPKEEKVDITQFKDGDIITCGWYNKHGMYYWTSILRGEIERITDNLFIADYCSMNYDGTYSMENGDSDSATYVRYATEGEKKELFDKIAKEGYEWLADERKLVKKWTPKKDEWYYHPYCEATYFKSWCVDWRGGEFDVAILNKGWVFRTEEECLKFCQKLNNAINQVKP